jgi:hypothetical protein
VAPTHYCVQPSHHVFSPVSDGAQPLSTARSSRFLSVLALIVDTPAHVHSCGHETETRLRSRSPLAPERERMALRREGPDTINPVCVGQAIGRSRAFGRRLRLYPARLRTFGAKRWNRGLRDCRRARQGRLFGGLVVGLDRQGPTAIARQQSGSAREGIRESHPEPVARRALQGVT